MAKIYIDRPVWPSFPKDAPKHPDEPALKALHDAYLWLQGAVPQGWELTAEVGHKLGEAEVTLRLARQKPPGVVS